MSRREIVGVRYDGDTACVACDALMPGSEIVAVLYADDVTSDPLYCAWCGDEIVMIVEIPGSDDPMWDTDVITVTRQDDGVIIDADGNAWVQDSTSEDVTSICCHCEYACESNSWLCLDGGDVMCDRHVTVVAAVK